MRIITILFESRMRKAKRTKLLSFFLPLVTRVGPVRRLRELALARSRTLTLALTHSLSSRTWLGGTSVYARHSNTTERASERASKSDSNFSFFLSFTHSNLSLSELNEVEAANGGRRKEGSIDEQRKT